MPAGCCDCAVPSQIAPPPPILVDVGTKPISERRFSSLVTSVFGTERIFLLWWVGWVYRFLILVTRGGGGGGGLVGWVEQASPPGGGQAQLVPRGGGFSLSFQRGAPNIFWSPKLPPPPKVAP